ncbi:MAG: hypothetical protein B1H08_03760 [Candidatus Omnitrophica bacterium 4484_171]|nr:MAG: hypothetical protein B1H08_03760 [Candidatus Omnitrophica bacterium 4484_171]
MPACARKGACTRWDIGNITFPRLTFINLKGVLMDVPLQPFAHPAGGQKIPIDDEKINWD